MPTYDYACTACGHTFEERQSMAAKPLVKCPKCKGKLKRLIGAGASLIFKGSGFYETDYRKSSASTSSSSASAPARPAAADKGAATAAKGASSTDKGAAPAAKTTPAPKSA